MKKVEIKYSNGKSVIVNSYEKNELDEMRDIKHLDLVSIDIDNVDLYIEKKNVVFEKCSYIHRDDVSFYNKLIDDNKVLSSLKLNKLIAVIFDAISCLSILTSLFSVIIIVLNNMTTPMIFSFISVVIFSIICSNMLLFWFSNKNNKTLERFLKNVNVEEIKLYNEKKNNSDTVEKFNYKEKSKDENEIIFQINEKMKDKLLYK